MKKKNLDTKAYKAYEANEPKVVIEKEKKLATKKLGKSASHKDAEKLEPISMKLEEAKKGKKLLKKKR